MYVYLEFPKWKYHPSKDPVIVQDADEEKALGDDWFDLPEQAANAMLAIKKKLESKQYDSK